MRRFALLLSLSALAVASACSDRSTSPLASPAAPRLSIDVPGQDACTALSEAQIVDLIDAVYANGSPDEQAAFGKWDNITKQRAALDREEVVKDKIIDLVDFTLDKAAQGKLVATDAQLTAMVNALFCYGAMANDYYYPGGGGQFIYPLDAKQTIVSNDRRAAITFEFDPVDVPTLVTITRTTDTLNTNLDKYQRVYEFSKYPTTSTFKQPAITEVCAEVPDALFPELVLGHNMSNGEFELLEKPSPEQYSPVLTQCDDPVPTGFASSVGAKLLELLLPQKLYAAMLGGGGITGTVENLSPIGPVDPRILVTKIGGDDTAPIGSLLSPAPGVRLSTPAGTLLGGITVNFAAVSGTGFANDASGIAPSVVSNAAGEATTPWRLGSSTTLQYGLTATAQVDNATTAVERVDFIEDFETFTATALPASGIEITSTQGTTTAGATIAAITARLFDAESRTVEGYAGNVAVTAPTGIALTGTTSKAVASGVVSFTDLSMTRAGTHTLTLKAMPGDFTATTNVTIAKGAPILSIVSGNGQSATVPATLGLSAPLIQVKVVDAYENPYSATTVYWTPFGGSTIPAASTTTDANGRANTTWTIEEGPNSLYASLSATLPPFIAGQYAEFTATGVPPRRGGDALLTCAVGTSRPGLADHMVRFLTPSRGTSAARIDEIKLFFSVQGDANPNTPKLYSLQMVVTEETRARNSDPWSNAREVARTTSAVPLRGNASQNDGAGNFVFASGFTPAAGSRLTLRVNNVGALDGTLRINAGTGADCAASTFNTNGTLFRASAGIQVFGAAP